MRRAAHAILLATALASTAGSVLAASLFSVGLNESRRVVLQGSAASVVVDDPTIADVAMVNSHSLIVLGRGYGATDVMVLDHAGRVLFDGRVRVSPPEDGRVTVHHGAAAADFYCVMARCAPLAPAQGSAAALPSGGAPGGGTPSTTITTAPTSAPAAIPGV